MKGPWRKGAALLLALIWGVACLPAGASDKLADRYEGKRPAGTSSSSTSSAYRDYLAAREEEGYTPAEADISLKAADFSASAGAAPEKTAETGGKTDVLTIPEDNEYVEWRVTVPRKGLYTLELEYYTGAGGRQPISREVAVNGKVPFEEAATITLYRLFEHDGEPRVNTLGDEVRPQDRQKDVWLSVPLADSMGRYSTPLLFAFEEGENTLRLSYIDQPLVLASITLQAPEEIPAYEEVLEGYRAAGHSPATQSLKFQAEGEALLDKNDFSITMYGDGDIYAEPKGVTHVRMNVMGGYTWKNGGQAITWRFRAPQTGLYKLALRGAQFWNDGIPSARRIAIDGEVPYQEFLEYRFPYSRGSQTMTLADEEGNPYLLYLQEGWHELTMTVQLGITADVFQELSDSILLLSDTIRKIVMVTGSDPDVNYDYELDKAIPTLMDDLREISAGMERASQKILAVSDRRPSMLNNFQLIKSQMDGMIKNPDSIPQKMDDLSSALTSLGDWLNSVIEQPLMVDYFLLLPPEAEVPNPQSNFWDKFIATMQNFAASFTKDYNAVGSFANETEIRETLDVWITKGKEWGEILKELTDSAFTSHSGIQIRLNVMPANSIGTGVNPLLLAINSGTAPDIGMGIASNQPVEYAIRNALADLSAFPDFEEVRGRFFDDILIPFTYQEKVFALPETMNTRLMYYRKDIFEENGWQVPNTWEEVTDTLMPALYQKNMEMYIPQLYDIFLFQHGGQFYTEDGLRSALDSPQAYTAFQQLVEFYTHLGVPVSANFLNRFRTGEMPVGIDNLGFYMTATYGAPELKGKWGVALIPGIAKGDEIDRSTGGMAADADVIVAQSVKKEAAWEFLKWWNSEVTQMEFAAQVEARIGTQARWMTANRNAFATLAFDRETKRVIQEAFAATTEQPIVLGGYFTSRHLTNALNRCIINHQPVRDSTEEMVEQINVELKRRQESQGIFAEP